LIDISQNIAENSIFGSGKIVGAKEATKKVTESAMERFY
jgi:hypothetical protein